MTKTEVLKFAAYSVIGATLLWATMFMIAVIS